MRKQELANHAATVILLLVAGVHAAHAAESCREGIPGEARQWAVAVCETRNETDDCESPLVQRCIDTLIKDDKIPDASSAECAVKLKYKSEICKSLVKTGTEKSRDACIKSTKNIPSAVQGEGD